MPTTLAGNPIIIDTRLREYEDFRTSALILASSNTPEWTDFFPSDPGVTLIECMSGMSDVLSYYIDRALNESHWNTCQLRQSIIDMASLINYTLSSAVSSTVDLTIYVDANGTIHGINSLTDAPFRVGNAATVDQKQFSFELLESEVVATAPVELTLTFIEGTTVFREVIGASDGSAGQFYQLVQYPLTSNPDGTPAVQIENNSFQWTYVDDLSESDAADLHFMVITDSAGKGLVAFGDGVNGAIPDPGSIFATYRIGGGSESNDVGIGKITTQLNTSQYVTSVNNLAKPSGGDDAETVEHARENGPKTYATQDRAVTHADYEALARGVSGVYKAKAGLLKNAATKEVVYIATTGDNPTPTGTWDADKQSGTGLLGVVGKVLVEKSCAATRIYMASITALDIEVEMEVVALDTVFKSKVLADVESVVDSYVRSETATTIPSLIPLSGLMHDIEAINGVDFVNVTKFHRKPYIEELQIGIANTTYSDVVAGAALETEIWTIYFTSSTTFTVEGSVTGLQTLTGTVGDDYVTDNGELAFTFTAGSLTNKVGDMYSINTSEIVGNVPVQATEIPILTDVTGITVTGGLGD